jgi:flagellar hook-associated protein 2
VNSLDTQTLQIASDTSSMSSSIQDFITKFNSLQTLIDTDTKVTVTGTNVSTSVLSGNREVEDWGRKLQSLAFEAVGGLTGSVSRLNDLGIDFNSTSGQLVVKNSGKLATALSDHPDDVQSFFLSPTAGFVPKLFGYLTNALSSDSKQQDNITKSNSDLDTQIATLQSKLDDERTNLTDSFIAMLDAQSSAQSQQTYLTNTFFKSSSG